MTDSRVKKRAKKRATSLGSSLPFLSTFYREENSDFPNNQNNTYSHYYLPFIILKGEKPRIHLKTLDRDLNICYPQLRNELKMWFNPFLVEIIVRCPRPDYFFIHYQIAKSIKKREMK